MAQTIEALRRELAEKEQRLEQMEAKRDQLNSQLAEIDQEIASLLGGTARAERAAKPARKTAHKKVAARKGKWARRGGKSLNDVLAEVLQGKGQVKVSDAARMAQEAGYKSKSSQFGNIVSQTLAKDSRFRKVGRGVYELNE